MAEIGLSGKTDQEIEQWVENYQKKAPSALPIVFFETVRNKVSSGPKRGRQNQTEARHPIPTFYTVRAYCQAGGLLSYASGDFLLKEFGRYTGRF